MSVLNRLAIVAMSLAFALVPASPRAEDTAPSFSPAQTEAVNKLIHDYLLNNPQVLVEAIEHADAANKAAAEQAIKTEIVNRHEELDNDPTSPVLGNPQGDVTVVEFFDYRCPYCKATAPAVARLLEQDKKVRLVMKEFPILGKESVFASRVAFVAQKHGKYAEFYKAMFDLKTTINEESTMEVAKSIGLDPEMVKKEMESADIDTFTKNNFDLAKAIGVEGTPAFVIGDALSPGTINTDQLKFQIEALRSKMKG